MFCAILLDSQCQKASRHFCFVLFASLLLLQGCSTKLYHQQPNEPLKASLIQSAQRLIGTPYVYGGENPDKGFDCSGFIHYTFTQNGIDIPRTSRAQYKQAFPVSRRQLRAGDLVFFRKKHEYYVSHVGLYIGEGKFIHAPSSGKKVTINRLDQKYWRKYYYSAGRIF